MTFNQFTRRLHLYLAMALLPWFAMYALSAFVFCHGRLISRLGGGQEEWTRRFDKAYDGALTPDADEAARRAFARRVVDDHGMECTFGVSPVRDGRITVWCFTFFGTTRIAYDLEKQRLTAEDDRFQVARFLTRMHGRGGFQHDGFLDDLWAVMVDLVCLGFLLWVISGLSMWWKVPRQRRWGAIALIAGSTSFIGFMLGL